MASVSTDRRYGINSGMALKVPCRVTTTTNITLSGEQTIDGVACITGDRVLVKDQTTGTENGIYRVDTGSWSRDADFDGSYDAVQGTLVYVINGTGNNLRSLWQLDTASPVIGSSSLSFSLANSVALVNALAASSGSSLIGFIQAGTGAVPRTAQDKDREHVSVKDFGAVGDGVTDDYAAILLAEAMAFAVGASLVFPYGTYYHTQDITLRCHAKFEGASLRYGGTGNALTITGNGLVIKNPKVTRTYSVSGVASSKLLYTGILILNSKNLSIYDPYVEGFASGIKPLSTGGNGCGYLRLFNPQVINCLTSWDVNSDVTDWVNEVDFFGGKMAIAESGFSSYVGSRYCKMLGTPASHKFHGTTMESTVVERKIECAGNENAWLNCYLEGNNGSTDIQLSGNRNVISGKDAHLQVITDTTGDNSYLGDYYKKLAGGVGYQYQVVSAAGTTDITAVSTVYVDTTLGNVTLRLLPPADKYLWKGLRVTIIKTSNDANTVTVYPLPSGPAFTEVLLARYAAATYENNGTTWYESGNSRVKYYREYTSANVACTGAITTSAQWKVTKVGNQVTLTLPAISGTASAAASFSFGEALPADFLPTGNFAAVSAPLVNNGANQSAPGLIFVATSGVISVFLNGTVSGNFSAGASAGLSYGTTVSWTV